MPRAEPARPPRRRPWGQRLRRADHRAALWTAGLLLAAIAAQALLVYAFVAIEGLEEADRWMAHALHAATRDDAADRATAGWEALRPVLTAPPSVRILDAEGRVRETHGAWPPPRLQVAMVGGDGERSLGDARLLRSGRALVGARSLADGRRLELAMPLDRFVEEAHEVGAALALLAGVSGGAALVVAGLAIAWAFAPLRRATRLVEGIDARHLGQRLPSRGTGDPVDRHAEALNRVLADADATFDRLRAFGADVAHELRTPLNRLQNVAEVALLGGDPAEYEPALERVQEAAEELSRTVRSLLLLAELDEGRIETRPEPLDLDAWLSGVVDLYAPLFEERGTALERSGRAGTLEVDRSLLDRVLANLLDNALLHGAAGGRVEIRARRDPAGVTLEVDDAGPGIPEAHREQVFARFARLDGARSGPGSGLGLSVARACARLAGGELSVGDSRLGGACFVWTLDGAVRTRSAGPGVSSRDAR